MTHVCVEMERKEYIPQVDRALASYFDIKISQSINRDGFLDSNMPKSSFRKDPITSGVTGPAQKNLPSRNDTETFVIEDPKIRTTATINKDKNYFFHRGDSLPVSLTSDDSKSESNVLEEERNSLEFFLPTSTSTSVSRSTIASCDFVISPVPSGRQRPSLASFSQVSTIIRDMPISSSNDMTSCTEKSNNDKSKRVIFPMLHKDNKSPIGNKRGNASNSNDANPIVRSKSNPSIEKNPSPLRFSSNNSPQKPSQGHYKNNRNTDDKFRCDFTDTKPCHDPKNNAINLKMKSSNKLRKIDPKSLVIPPFRQGNLKGKSKISKIDPIKLTIPSFQRNSLGCKPTASSTGKTITRDAKGMKTDMVGTNMSTKSKPSAFSFQSNAYDTSWTNTNFAPVHEDVRESPKGQNVPSLETSELGNKAESSCMSNSILKKSNFKTLQVQGNSSDGIPRVVVPNAPPLGQIEIKNQTYQYSEIAKATLLDDIKVSSSPMTTPLSSTNCLVISSDTSSTNSSVKRSRSESCIDMDPIHSLSSDIISGMPSKGDTFTRHKSHEDIHHRKVRFDPRVWVHEFCRNTDENIWFTSAELQTFKQEAMVQIQRWNYMRSFDMISSGTGRIISLSGRKCKANKQSAMRALFTNPALSADAEEDVVESIAIREEINVALITEIKAILIIDTHDILLKLLSKGMHAMFPHVTIRTAQSAQEGLHIISSASTNNTMKKTDEYNGFDLILVEERLNLHHKKNNELLSNEVLMTGSMVIKQLKEGKVHQTFSSITSSPSHDSTSSTATQNCPLLIGISAHIAEDKQNLKNSGADEVWAKPPPPMNSLLRNEILKKLITKRKRQHMYDLFS
mmetsp:Transcript_17701/g.24975  ORF Transcript_17701/g.24975 Transcript_17701/m.24975 type:complete len:849 (+) Transcript_17701:231-2777(+)